MSKAKIHAKLNEKPNAVVRISKENLLYCQLKEMAALQQSCIQPMVKLKDLVAPETLERLEKI